MRRSFLESLSEPIKPSEGMIGLAAISFLSVCARIWDSVQILATELFEVVGQVVDEGTGIMAGVSVIAASAGALLHCRGW